ncbi:MAG: DUF2608 domain-containing protein [Coxiellaceae bacterium]|nr:DUF2608 domain-containing protein [Coxiellaceae bacterium]
MKKLLVGLLSMAFGGVCAHTVLPGKYQMHNLVSADFKHLVKQVHQQYGKDMLLVFDDDNTLETTDKKNYGYLGGAAWYDWQSGLLKNNPDSKQLMAHSVSELLTEQRFLFSVIPMRPTEHKLVRMVDQFEKQRVPVLVETARGPEMGDVTQNSLQKAQLHFNYYNKAVLPTFKPSDRLCQVSASGRDASLARAVYFVSGQNKGEMLDCLFVRLGQYPKAIVFVDDTDSNDREVYHYFQQRYPTIKVFTVTDNHLQSVVSHFRAKQKHQAWKLWRQLQPQYQQWLRDNSH